MKQAREEAFAAQMEKWNRADQGIALMLAGVIVLINTLYCIALDITSMEISLWTRAKYLCEIGITGINYGICEFWRYTKVQGGNGKREQDLLQTISRMPFPLESYFAVVRRRMRRREVVIGAAVACGYLANMFITLSGTGTGLCLKALEHPLGAVLTAVTGTVFPLLCMEGIFRDIKRRYCKRYHEQREGMEEEHK